MINSQMFSSSSPNEFQEVAANLEETSRNKEIIEDIKEAKKILKNIEETY